MADNETRVIDCKSYVPQSTELVTSQATSSTIILVIIWICVIVIVAIFVEEVIFIARKFVSDYRKRKTIYVLALAPTYALCAIIGVMMPRAGTLVDLVSNSYFGLAIYSLMCLIGDYLGTQYIEEHQGVQNINLATFPCCCCCPCLPKPTFNRKNYIRLLLMIYQVTFIRPLVAFLSAILWADDQYVPGKMVADNAWPYLAVINTLSTMASVWGLVIIQRTFHQYLLKHCVGLKFLFLQLTLLGTLIGNIVIGILVSEQVIPCTHFIPSNARAQRLDNTYVIVWMVLVSLIGRVGFRRYGDALDDDIPEQKLVEMESATDGATSLTKLNSDERASSSDEGD